MDKEIMAVPLNKTAEEFYSQKDSVYVRIQYIPEGDGYKFELWNELSPENVNDSSAMMLALARGFIEAAIHYPGDIYTMGKEAFNRDYVHSNGSNEEKDLYIAEPASSAIN